MGPTFVQINHSHLLHNFNLIREAVKPAKVMAVVKADAYGHGSIEIAKTLQEINVDYLGVAFPEEGIALRKAGVKTRILVFGAQLTKYF
ncbi:MAG: bifunctional UDP-N-acetylmuramoyl-tripeptide:D-alanyl-D-alanine ligase/alanine racemase, partial [Gammaproteobacteria bacterium]|nr:bifunctional UDP-N-acetylmuramoyl-tripeptide:D-alanyl-D-alanine ligase/alanine racemase [Gammaproteobacteria bacterium]